MKTYQIVIEGQDKFIKSEANSLQVQEAIDFVKKGEVSIEKILQALRMLGFKTIPVTIEPVDIFEV